MLELTSGGMLDQSQVKSGVATLRKTACFKRFTARLARTSAWAMSAMLLRSLVDASGAAGWPTRAACGPTGHLHDP